MGAQKLLGIHLKYIMQATACPIERPLHMDRVQERDKREKNLALTGLQSS